MRKLFGLSCLLCIISLSVLDAEEKSPREPEIVLPKMILDVAELKPEKLDPVLPPPSELPLVLSPLSAPVEEPPLIPDSLLRPELPAETLRTEGKSLSSLYTQGILGAGSMNSIIGGLSFYKTGENDRYRVLFSHEGLDGYAFHDPGSGFSLRKERIEGSANFDLTHAEIFTEAGFREEETGLQGTSAAHSAILRSTRFLGGIDWKPSDSASLRTLIEGAAASRLLTGNIPIEDTEYVLRAETRGRLDERVWSLSLGGSYDLRNMPGTEDLPLHRGRGDLGLELFPFEFLRIDGSLGLFVNDIQGLLVPFHLGLNLRIDDGLSLFAKGGKRIDLLNYRDLWNRTVFLSPQASVRDGETLFGSFGFDLRALEERFYVKTALSIEGRQNAVVLGPYDPVLSGFSGMQEELLTAVVSVESRFTFGRGLTLQGDYRAYLGERTFLEKTHLVDAKLFYAPETSRFGANLDALWTLGGGNEPPEIGIGGYFRPREGLEISLSFEDLFGPLLDEGRTLEAPFIAPGFRGLIKTVLSF